MTTKRIDQAVFGYRDGHRLLQASRQFSPSAERTLSILSDMSGPRMIEGFEEYLSGYPLVGEKAYAFCKTWYASEMERPGCVWTHALIIDFQDIEDVNNAFLLVSQFCRPDLRNLAPYSQALLVDFSTSQLPYSASGWETAQVLDGLYGAEAAVVIPAMNSGIHEGLTLAIWSQQWPALRGEFRFCTGSLGVRSTESQSYDLQVVPHRLLREFGRESKAIVVSNQSDSRTEETGKEWLRITSRDLEAPNYAFREFLWQSGESSARPRELFRNLVTCYQEVSTVDGGTGSVQKLLKQVSATYPSPLSGQRLKSRLFGNPSSIRSEPELLKELAVSQYSESLDATSLDLRARGSALWRIDRAAVNQIIDLAADVHTKTLCEQLLNGMAEAMDSSDICELAQKQPNLATGMIARNLRLVALQDTWRCPTSFQWKLDLLDILKSQIGESDRLQASVWMPAVIEATPDLAEAVLDRFREEAVDAWLTWYGQHNQDPLQDSRSSAWSAALCKHSDCVALWADLRNRQHSVSTLVLLAGLLDPNDESVISAGFEPWLPLTDEGQALLDQVDAAATSFLFSLALKQQHPTAASLLVVSFERVHSAAASGVLNSRGWQFLNDQLPRLSWRRNWDKCERIRRALLGQFIKYRWRTVDFVRCIRKTTTLRGVLYTSRDVDDGESFVCSVAEQVFAGLFSVEPEQAAVFRNSFRTNRHGQVRLNLD